MSASILIIDDEETLRKALERFLVSQGYQVSAVSQWEKGFLLLKEKDYDLVMVDLMLPNISGIELVKKFREVQPALHCIVMTGFGSISSAIEAIQAGAYHYITKPFNLSDVHSLIIKALEHSKLEAENKRIKEQLRAKHGFEEIVGESRVMKEIFDLVMKVADTESTVLITGESGTGKELIAQAIHYRSQRADGPFVAVNCAAIPEGLLESELFGHVKGAFTGAIMTRPGKFEQAHGGTIFLDEIGDMSPKLQVKVLRVLQEKILQPVGGSHPQEVNVRILAATNQDLRENVSQGKFREDLFYRLNVIPVHLPALRNRTGDIPILTKHFLQKYNLENQKKVTGFSRPAMSILTRYSWPGNVRELENLVERLVVLKGQGIIQEPDVIPILKRSDKEVRLKDILFSEEGIDLKEAVIRFEKDLIYQAMERCQGNRNQAASLLRINRTTLIEKLRKLDDGKRQRPIGG